MVRMAPGHKGWQLEYGISLKAFKLVIILVIAENTSSLHLCVLSSPSSVALASEAMIA